MIHVNLYQMYNGGNKLPNETVAMAEAMGDIRQRIFASQNGTIDSLQFHYLHSSFS